MGTSRCDRDVKRRGRRGMALADPAWRSVEEPRSGAVAMQDEIRCILAESGRLAVPVESVSDDAGHFAAGLDAVAVVVST